MKLKPMVIVMMAGMALAASAQQVPPADSGVITSTDPARAAAVERQAQALKARAGNAPKVFFRGRTDAGVAILSGGNTVDDRVVMHAERDRYSLWVATVARPSGAYLSDVRLRITNLADKSVAFERTLEGPWLMLALPAGKYELTATFRDEGARQDQTLTSRVTVAKAGQRQAVLRFDSTAEVSTEANGPFKGNPFGAPSARK